MSKECIHFLGHSVYEGFKNFLMEKLYTEDAIYIVDDINIILE